MKKPYIQFLSLSFLISYTAFGVAIYPRLSFQTLITNPFYVFILILGFLGPFVSSLLTFYLNKDILGGLQGFNNVFKTIVNKRNIYLIPLFLAAHYGFAMILNNIFAFNSLTEFIYYFPLSLILLGSQEIGWRFIVQPALETDKGYLKSIIATGLFWSLWFLPLLFIPSFFILPQLYLQFTIYLVGISFLLTGIYKASGSIAYTTLLSALIFGFYPIFILKQNYILLVLTILESLIANIYKDKGKVSNYK